MTLKAISVALADDRNVGCKTALKEAEPLLIGTYVFTDCHLLAHVCACALFFSRYFPLPCTVHVFRFFLLSELMRGQNLSHSQRNVLFELAGNIQIHEVRTRLNVPMKMFGRL